MIQIYSLNVNGLNSNFKRQLALKSFRDSGADVIFMQETHFDKRGTLEFASRHFPLGYLAFTPKKKAGVTILIKKCSPFHPISCYSDPGGRLLILRGKWQQADITFCNLYAPNVKQTNFLTWVYNRLFWLTHSCWREGTLTYHSPQRWIAPPFPRPLLLCAWPENPNYSVRLRVNLLYLMRGELGTQQIVNILTILTHFRMHARLDYVFVNGPFLRVVKSASISPISWLDHVLILLKLTLDLSRLKRCHWQHNDFLLKNETTRTELEKALKLYFTENSTPGIATGVIWESHKSFLRGQCIAISTVWKRNSRLLRWQTEMSHRDLKFWISSASYIEKYWHRAGGESSPITSGFLWQR